VRALRRIVAQTGVSYSAVAVLCQISPATARRVLEMGELPRLASARAAIARFVERNARAKRREELALV